jgi:hypothetical protein
LRFHIGIDRRVTRGDQTMRNFRTLAAIVVLLFFANLGWAQGTISFDSGYPKPGTDPGTISVSGTIVIDDPCSAWVWSGDGALWTIWKDDCVIASDYLTIQDGSLPKQYTWNGIISGFDSLTSYNVTVEVMLSNGCDMVTVKTALATATTK